MANDLVVPHEVEIWRAGQIFIASMADLQAGDCFCKTDNPSRWFKCLTDVSTTWYLGAPTYMVKGLEVLQAAPTSERPIPRSHRLEKQPPPKQIEDNVIDMEFREVP